MVTRHDYRGGVWIDLEQPSADEIREIAQEFSVSARLEREMHSPTPTPMVVNEGDAELLVLHFPAHGAEDGKTENQELDFIVGKEFIITVRYAVVAPLHHLQKLLETQKLVAAQVALTTDVLLEVLFAHLYTSVHDHTNHTVSRLASIETDMFDGAERRTILSILQVSREFLHMETAIANQEEPLGRFIEHLGAKNYFGPTFLERGERILASRTQIAHLVKTHRAVAAELRETNIALLESHQNEIMKTLTVISFILMPLELLTIMLGMHLPGTPFFDSNPNSFWVALAFLFSVAGIMIIVAARKRWLN